MEHKGMQLTRWLSIVLVALLCPIQGVTIEINQKTSGGNLMLGLIEMEIRWATGCMENGCQIESGDSVRIRVPGKMESKDEAYYLLFLGTTIRNQQKEALSFSLKDFSIEVDDQVLTPSAYLVNNPVFVATSANPQFSIDPNDELDVGIGFVGVPKVNDSLRVNFLDLPAITIAKPPVK